MVTIKKGRGLFVLGVMLAGVLAWGGCKPPGVRAFMNGERLLEAGDSEAAVGEFLEATRLLPTNAMAWNYLGLAYHRSGQPRSAHEAYARAVSLDGELAVAHYNLGCLYFEQKNAALAVSELTIYTLREPRSFPGWLKLGNAQLLSEEAGALAGCYTAFKTALELEPGHPDALNGLGLMEMKRDRPKDALFYFNEALKADPENPKVLLNVAIVAHEKLHDNGLALESYKKYLALEPRPANWEAVAAAARDIELELEGVSGVSVAAGAELDSVLPEAVELSNAVAAVEVGVTQPVEKVVLEPAAGTNGVEMPDMEAEVTAVATVEVAQARSTEAVPPVRAEPEVEANAGRVEPDPPARGAAISSLSPVSRQTQRERSFVRRLEPRSESNPSTAEVSPPRVVEPVKAVAPTTTSRAPVSSTRAPTPVQKPELTERSISAVSKPSQRVYSGRRYIYLSPPRAASGNRAVAERYFREGVKAQKDGRLPVAVIEYRKATQADPSYFEAFYNQGLAALQLRDWKQSLAAYEYALAEKPSSADARYNFALALQEGGYQVDAAAELSTLLSQHPGDVRAHLSLANVYAKLGQAEAARTHYEKVLALNPSHPQSGRIRSWLAGNR